ncbi:hypothetical protein BGZ61DRAFT_574139 [Ilyonectria robusta]|uniref:uncharacterized protein n=1 Tax=Ilyonectria robusta TaxID=1079257 RepID=UPI001E8D4D02|nr:uncharacterized protein BGZ61DRAFT_574139 [Ilyonectria robusta]KAH8714275.1 hypothetical protein BGZ61DRAFT_574139 [Ilyonectria robusta]
MRDETGDDSEPTKTGKDAIANRGAQFNTDQLIAERQRDDGVRKRKPGSRNGSEAASGFYSTTTTTAGKAGVRRQTASRQKKSEKARVKKRNRQLAGRHGGRPLGGIVVARRDSQSRIKTQSHTRFPAPAPAAVSLALARAQPKRRPVTPGSSAAHAIKAGYCNACCTIDHYLGCKNDGIQGGQPLRSNSQLSQQSQRQLAIVVRPTRAPCFPELDLEAASQLAQLAQLAQCASSPLKAAQNGALDGRPRI